MKVVGVNFIERKCGCFYVFQSVAECLSFHLEFHNFPLTLTLPYPSQGHFPCTVGNYTKNIPWMSLVLQGITKSDKGREAVGKGGIGHTINFLG